MELFSNEIINKIKDNTELTKKLIKNYQSLVKDNINLKIYEITSLSGLLIPIYEYLKDEFSELDNKKLNMILNALILECSKKNIKKFESLLREIKEEKILDVYKIISDKKNKLLKSYRKFVDDKHFLDNTELIPFLPFIQEKFGKIDDNIINDILKTSPYQS